MKVRRAILLYTMFLFCFFLVICRLYLLATDTTSAARAQKQTVTTLVLETSRGNFYDCKGQLLTGTQPVYYALCIPGEESYARLFGNVDFETQNYLYQKRNSATPFLVQVDEDLTEQGIYTYTGVLRYSERAVCVHLIGYLDGEGEGVTGLELAFEEVLRTKQEQSYVQCVTNGQGQLMDETEPTLYTADKEALGVQLTISKEIQRACEGIAAATMEKGCIFVLDVNTAEVRACVSYPFYDPEDVNSSIQANDTSLLNRAFSAYNVGSVFKPVLAAAALEEGLSWVTIECNGYVEKNGQVYRCAGGVPHGTVDLQTALQKSCNCYFIELGERLGAARLLGYAEAFGFGEPQYLAGGLKSAAGNLPTEEALKNSGQRANFSFGQGQLLATPLQLAAMMNAVAAGGLYQQPCFLKATVVTTEAGLSEVEQLDTRLEGEQIISKKTAQTLQKMLCLVVEQGTGGAAMPTYGASGGKTGTAQTGRYNPEGQEYQDLWFTGFYPAQQPQYTIVVMQDDQVTPKYSSAQIFADVCDALYWLDAVELPEETGESAADLASP